MTYEQLNIAFVDALRQGDHARCTEMLDQFIQTAKGVELGHALSLKAGYLLIHDERRSVEGLSLVEEALALAADCPELLIECVNRGVGLCYNIGDTERARRYETLGHQLLQQYADNAFLLSMRPLLYSNLAAVASLRQEPAQAYWHLLQATKWLVCENETPDTRRRLFRIYVRTAEVSLDMHRTPEADDALMKAKLLISSTDEHRSWCLFRANYLVAMNQAEGAKRLLEELTDSDLKDWPGNDRVRYHLALSLIAQTQHDIRGFHYHLARAQDHALEKGLDHMLAKIQRVMRTPVPLEAAK